MMQSNVVPPIKIGSNSYLSFKTGWAGLVRGQQRPSPAFNVVPVSPVVNSKKSVPSVAAQVAKKPSAAAKPVQKPQQKVSRK